MTLTTLMPSIRRSIPDPLDSLRWPDHTTATTTDVVVSGVSRCGLVELCGTPCVHTASAAVPLGRQRPAHPSDASVVIVRVRAG